MFLSFIHRVTTMSSTMSVGSSAIRRSATRGDRFLYYDYNKSGSRCINSDGIYFRNKSIHSVFDYKNIAHIA